MALIPATHLKCRTAVIFGGIDSFLIRHVVGDFRKHSSTGLWDNDIKSDGVVYSLNKKNRWSLPALIKWEIIHGDHEDDEFGIQLVERRKIAKVVHCISIYNTRSKSSDDRTRVKQRGNLHLDSKWTTANHRKCNYNRQELTAEKTAEQSLEQPQIRYDVLYPMSRHSTLIRNSKSIKLETHTNKREQSCSTRRRPNRHRKHVSKEVIREAFDILYEVYDVSEEEDITMFDEEEEFSVRKSVNTTLKDILQRAQVVEAFPVVPGKRGYDNNRNSPTEGKHKRNIVYLEPLHNEAVLDVRVAPAVSVPTTKSTTLEPVIVALPFEQIMPHALRGKYGECYIECDCYPRKFIVDISDRVSSMERFKSYKKNTRTVNACLVFTVDEENDMNTEFSTDANLTRTVLKDSICQVILNSDFCDHIANIKIETLFDYMEVNMDELIARTLFFLETLPDNAVRLMYTSASFGQEDGKRSHLEGFARWSTHSYAIDGEFLVRYLFSKDHTRTLFESFSEPVIADTTTGVSSLRDNFCGICYNIIGDENPTTALASCDHWFCNRCWREYLDTKIRNGRIALPCPEYDCEKEVDPGTALSFVSMATILKYAKCRHDTEVERLAETRWCPNERCGRVLYVSSLDVKVATCVCGEQCCLDCLGKPHWPADCDSAKSFQQTMKTNGDCDMIPSEFDRGVVVNGKHCPRCRRFIEKYDFSCILMTCFCGAEFCWGCGLIYRGNTHSPKCYSEGVNDNHGTIEKKVYQEDKLGKLKRRKWYKIALAHRLAKHPMKYQKMKSAARLMSKKVRDLIIGSEKKGKAVTLDFQAAGKVYSKEYDKVGDFLKSMIDLYTEISRLVENVAVLLDSKGFEKDGTNRSLQCFAKRLSCFPDVIYDLFVRAEGRDVMNTLKGMKHIRLNSRNVVCALVKYVEA